MLMRHFFNNSEFSYSLSCVSRSLVFFTPSPVQELEKVVTDKSVSYANDIYLLLNQRRIDRLVGADTFNSWIQSLMPHSDALASLRSKCSDAELMAICKSRYIQSPSELLAWSQYLNDNYEYILSELKAAEPAEPAEPAAPAEPAPANS